MFIILHLPASSSSVSMAVFLPMAPGRLGPTSAIVRPRRPPSPPPPPHTAKTTQAVPHIGLVRSHHTLPATRAIIGTGLVAMVARRTDRLHSTDHRRLQRAEGIREVFRVHQIRALIILAATKIDLLTCGHAHHITNKSQVLDIERLIRTEKGRQSFSRLGQ